MSSKKSNPNAEQLRKIAELQTQLAKLQLELAQMTEKLYMGQSILSLEDLEIKISELRNHELMSRPVNHVGPR